MNDKEFEEKYWKVCEELKTKHLDEQQMNSLENALSTHNGGKPHEFKINNKDILRELKGEYDD